MKVDEQRVKYPLHLLRRLREDLREALSTVREQIEQFAPAHEVAVDGFTPREPPGGVDRPSDLWNVQGDFHEARGVADGLCGGEGRPGGQP